MISHKSVRASLNGRTAWITLDRPPLNVMNIAMMEEMHAEIEGMASSADFLVFQGAGEKGFSAGADAGDHTPERVAEMLRTFHRVFRQIWRSRLITVAAVHGYCLGGGCELATFCDFVVATESAQFGQPEITLGCFPPVAMVMFPRLIGMRATVDLILSGRTISAREAQQLGLVLRLVPNGGLEAAVASLLAELRSLSPSVLNLVRRALSDAAGFDFDQSLQSVEDFYLRDLMKTEDAREGIRAFLEKRAPVWQGR